MKDGILILDFGSQYTRLINNNLCRLSLHSVIEPADIRAKEALSKHNGIKIKGIILSGGAFSVNQDKINFDNKWLNYNLPILGICYGHQLLAKLLGGTVRKTGREYGGEDLYVNSKSLILKNVKPISTVWMSHADTVIDLPIGFKSLASTSISNNAIIGNVSKKLYGFQFHPEVSHSEEGLKLLSNFAKDICKTKELEKWTPDNFFKRIKVKYQKTVGKEKIVVALSGGVDSTTLIAVLRRFFPKDQLVAVYIDSGLMPTETKDEVIQFCDQYDIKLITRNSSDIFFKKLKRIIDPVRKRKIIGRIFIEEFEEIASQENASFFAQGTIWSDVVESGVTKFSSQIKPHHNVGGLPKTLKFELIEPFRELFKDQVRELAQFLDLPKQVVNKKVFPGPGFALRVDGEVREWKVGLVRKCTRIIEEVISQNTIDSEKLMAFAILINVDSSSIKGDEQVKNKNAIVVRIVETKNLMTANFSQKVYPYLEEISNRIIKETNTGKVLYDITNKPPSTIDWQ